MTEGESSETLEMFLNSVRPGEVRTATVASFVGMDVVVDLDGAAGVHRAAGVVCGRELSWSDVRDPAEVVRVGQTIQAEVISVDRRAGQVLLSARACEDQPLRDFLLTCRPGQVVTGTVTEIHNFGVFVSLDGEPANPATDLPGTGFIRVPELSWLHIRDVADVVEVDQRVAAEVLDVDTRRGQVAVSLKALHEDPLVRLENRVGELVSGHVTTVTPIGIFVRVADGIEGLLPLSELPVEPRGDPVEVGQPITVTIAQVDPRHRRVRLTTAATL